MEELGLGWGEGPRAGLGLVTVIGRPHEFLPWGVAFLVPDAVGT